MFEYIKHPLYRFEGRPGICFAASIEELVDNAGYNMEIFMND
jgi:hypothetical protein